MNQKTVNPLLIEDYEEILKKVDSSTMKSFKKIVSSKTYKLVEREFQVMEDAIELKCINGQHLFDFKKVIRFIEETLSNYNRAFFLK